jgi:apolipoprotein N-acyltransferase
MPLRKHPLIAAALAGALTVGGFAPFGWFPLPVLTLALLIALWRGAASPRAAALTGFVFGFACFTAGVSWVYVSMHDFGAMPPPLAVALTLLLCAYLALFPAFAGWALRALGGESAAGALVILPALWTLTEWVRGWLFTGFPWLAIGYSQVPVSPLAGYIPVLGVYGATLLTVASAALLCTGISLALEQRGRPRPHAALSLLDRPWLLALVVLWAGGHALKSVEWTEPFGEHITVALVQGNISQDMKWREDRLQTTLDTYSDLVTGSAARLTVLPETAMPLFLHNVPRRYLDGLAEHARRLNGDILIGVPERGDARTYFNTVFSVGSAAEQFYRKSHLVPFGEFIPLKPVFGWFLDFAQIPLADFARGGEMQQPLEVAGQKVAVNICYEDAFGAEIARQLPQATLLVNVSNVAWFGRSIAPQQHLQISQARALETGRTMLRATNTGMTAIIDPQGRVTRVAPEFAATVVRGEVQGRAGATPYVRWRDLPVIVGALLLVIAGTAFSRRTLAARKS